MKSTVEDAYDERVARGALSNDPVQRLMASKLTELQRDLQFVRGSSVLARLWQTRPSGGMRAGIARGRGPSGAVRGLYFHGGVGRGKTLLMDMFFEQVAVKSKQRMHFHAFMRDVHANIAAQRKSTPGDPIPLVAQSVLARGKLLCFDEFHVTDIADAMILGRLFKALFEGGAVIVATSNVAPGDLYSDGLNRDLFLPFIDVLQAQMEIVSVDGEVDHRLRALEGRSTYFAPLGPAADTQMRGLWQDLTGTEYGQPATLAIAGRQIAIPHAHGRAAMGDFGDWFDFDGWSGQALGASDYLVMVEAYEWIFVRNVPVMGPDKNNAARRFVTFIDAVYDVGRQVVITAEAEPSDLYVHGPGANLFERTASRLIEMRVANPADIDARYKQSRTQALREKPWAMPPV